MININRATSESEDRNLLFIPFLRDLTGSSTCARCLLAKKTKSNLKDDLRRLALLPNLNGDLIGSSHRSVSRVKPQSALELEYLGML